MRAISESRWKDASRAVQTASAQPTVMCVTLTAIALGLADTGSHWAGNSFLPGGPLDELAHLLTALLVLWAIGTSRRRRFIIPTLFASVAIDLDHVPGELGGTWLTQGTPRPYTHSLLTIAVIACGAVLVRRWRTTVGGVTLGLLVHFLRDLSEPGTGVALLWPWSSQAFSVPHLVYIGAMAPVVGMALFRAARVHRPSPLSVNSGSTEHQVPGTSAHPTPPDHPADPARAALRA